MCLDEILIISRLAESILRDQCDLIHTSILYLPTDQRVCNKRIPQFWCFLSPSEEENNLLPLSLKLESINLYSEVTLIKLSEDRLQLYSRDIAQILKSFWNYLSNEVNLNTVFIFFFVLYILILNSCCLCAMKMVIRHKPESYCSKCGLSDLSASFGNLLEIQTLRSHPDLLNRNAF